MATILLLNGGKAFGNSGGRLSQTLHNVAKQALESLGFKVIETIIDKGYNAQEEVRKIADSDVLIYQMPAWWMGEPWIVKKYIDEVYLEGAGILFKNDGRSRKHSAIPYFLAKPCQKRRTTTRLKAISWALKGFTSGAIHS